MGSKSTAALIEQAVNGFLEQVPPLKRLKLVFGLELRGGRDIQLYRVQLPGPEIKKDLARDERVLIQMDRPVFNQLAEKGTLKSYRKAFETGQIRVEGDSNVQKLIGQVVEKEISRRQLRKAR